jgi:threonine 3-dehydrogenase
MHTQLKKYGKENVLLTDVKKPNDAILSEGPYTYVNVLNYDEMEAIVVNERIDWIVNFSALLSAVAEENVSHAMAVNMKGFENCINLAKVHNLKVFCPSTIGAFGPTSPKMNTPDLTIQRPRTIYGVTKVYVELLGEYYHHCFDTDFRSIRFPGVVSALTPPGGGTTDYAVHIFYDALQNGYYKCFLREDSRLPMIYIDDCIRATVALMETPDSKLSMRTYNINALSFTPEELTNELRRHIPQLKVEYVPDHRQAIGTDLYACYNWCVCLSSLFCLFMCLSTCHI